MYFISILIYVILLAGIHIICKCFIIMYILRNVLTEMLNSFILYVLNLDSKAHVLLLLRLHSNFVCWQNKSIAVLLLLSLCFFFWLLFFAVDLTVR